MLRDVSTVDTSAVILGEPSTLPLVLATGFTRMMHRRRGRRCARCCARVRVAGIDVLVLTVDTPVGGARLRDVRNACRGTLRPNDQQDPRSRGAHDAGD